MALLTLFVRKEKTTDGIAILHGLGDRLDTVAYRDRECTDLKARWPWHQSGCPDRRYRSVMLNCFRWKLEWIKATPAVMQ